MQTFESGGALVIEPGRQTRALIAAFALGAAAMAVPPLVALYLLLVA